MGRDDVVAVSAVDRLCFALPWSENAFLGETTNTVGYYRVAELDGRIVGYIGSHMILDEAHVTTFGVHPAIRRRHVGECLLADLLEQALRSGCRRITLEVRESNAAAQGLYRKYGFSPISRRRRYYPDNNEDAIVMWIEDTSRLGFRTLLAERLAALRAMLECGGEEHPSSAPR
jgi:ribosomal-protein-alanine N-acetyltransferase